MVVVLFAVSDGEPKLEPAGLEQLAKLGVTNVVLVRDASTAGVVLEGWAFDVSDTPRAVRAVAGVREGVRTLRPLAQMAVSSAADGGDGKE